MGIFDALTADQQPVSDNVIAQQPRRGFFAQVMENHGLNINAQLQAKQAHATSRILDEAMQSAIDEQGGDNVDAAAVAPRAYLIAAKKIADLGNPELSAELYNKGLALSQDMANKKATTRKLNAEASKDEAGPFEYPILLDQQGTYKELLDKFPEGSKTRQALQDKIDGLQERMDFLTQRNAQSGALVQEFNIRKKENDEEIAKAKAEGRTPPKVLTAKDFFTGAHQNTADLQAYNAYAQPIRDAGGTPEPEATWIEKYRASKAAGDAGAQAGVKRLDQQYGEAMTARDSNYTIGAALQSLNSPNMITGSGANLKAGAARVMDMLLGRQTDGTSLSADTDTYLASTRALVLARAKALGTGNGFTDTDRQFVEAMAAGDVTKVKSALRKMLGLMSAANDRTIDAYNGRLANMGDSYKTIANSFQPLDNPKLDFGEPQAAPPAGSRKVTLKDGRKVILNGKNEVIGSW